MKQWDSVVFSFNIESQKLRTIQIKCNSVAHLPGKLRKKNNVCRVWLTASINVSLHFCSYIYFIATFWHWLYVTTIRMCCCRFFLFSSVCSVLFCFAFDAIEPNGAFDHIVMKIAAFTYIRFQLDYSVESSARISVTHFLFINTMLRLFLLKYSISRNFACFFVCIVAVIVVVVMRCDYDGAQ